MEALPFLERPDLARRLVRQLRLADPRLPDKGQNRVCLIHAGHCGVFVLAAHLFDGFSHAAVAESSSASACFDDGLEAFEAAIVINRQPLAVPLNPLLTCSLSLVDD